MIGYPGFSRDPGARCVTVAALGMGTCGYEGILGCFCRHGGP